MINYFFLMIAAAAAGSLYVLVNERENSLLERDGVAEAERDAHRKKRAKRFNERLKLISAFSNALGVAFIATSVLAPLAAGRTDPLKGLTVEQAELGCIVALIVHLLGQLALHFWKSED